MVEQAKNFGMDALAITDHGVMFGVMEFYLECKKAKIKPLLGVEAYVAPQGIQKRGGRADNEYFHLLLLAKNLEGYRNLCKLSTIAALEGYYYKPRVDHNILREHSSGLIATSACLGSEICQALLANDYALAQRTAGMYAEMFGKENFFIELQDHGLPEQRQIHEPLLRIAQECKLETVATNDAHYLCREDFRPHDVLLCIGTGSNVADEKRLRFQTDQFYLKSPQEMSDLFPNDQRALENTIRIADLCDVQLDKERAPMPQPEIPEGMTSMDFLRQLAEKGLYNRSSRADESLDRLHYELSVIETTGFQDYFLLVREFANATRDRGIYFGVRGSAAGSLVSYAIGVTDVDPVEYDLTFERFLNPERISMPDIDMDFEDARRDEIIQYVTDRFGKDRVAQIVTFGTLGAKAAIKDCGRVLGYSPQETDRLTKAIPSLAGWSLQRAYDEVKEFRDLVNSDPRNKTLYEHAKSVEGIARHPGVHAAGVVISKDPLVDYVPLYRGTDGQAITAFEMGILEKIGLLKMDFLGLSNLTVLARAVHNVNRRRAREAVAVGGHAEATIHNETSFDIHTIPLDDEATFAMLGRGETIGVFQLEGGGMTRWVQQLKPANVRELAAMIALYRPGPMDHIPTFIDTKFGRRQAIYLDSRMRPILEETYGVIVYQDQVLKLVQALAGFSLGKADVLRRAMGKKDASAMASMKVEFLAGASANGVQEEIAEKVWELLLPFAGYAFNKAHAVCYSLLAYQTAYLKANFPVEYMAALLSVYLDKEDKVTSCIEECRRMKIAVLPPCVNHSLGDFSLEESGRSKAVAIRFGLSAIKGVGEAVVEALVKERTESGPFQHLYEFAERTRPLGVTRITLESLIRAGALDSLDRNRNRLLQCAEAALAYADSATRAKLAGQDSLFEGSSPGNEESKLYPVLPDTAAATRAELLAMEKEVMGIYLSDHPLRGHERSVVRGSSHRCEQVPELEDGVSVKLAGVIANLRTIVTKSKGERMASLVLEDFTGQIGGIVFPKSFDRLRDELQKDRVVQVFGYVMHRELRGEKSVEVRVEDIKPLEPDAPFDLDGDSCGLVRMSLWRATDVQLRAIQACLGRHPGNYSIMLQVLPETDFAPILLPVKIEPSEEFRRSIEDTKAKVELTVLHSAEP
jgi:DNA polymerase-3 subunit alpha